MANGRVVTGFSKPYIADYAFTNNAISYSNCMPLARGVSVDISIDDAETSGFYADDQLAESDSGVFTSGSFTLVVDGLKANAEKSIQGLPVADSDGFINYNDDQNKGYKGIGYLARYQESGVVTWVPTIIVKGMFNQIARAAKTQEQNKEYQTQQLSGRIHRGDDAKHTWLKVSETEYDSAAEAEAALVAALGGTASQSTNP